MLGRGAGGLTRTAPQTFQTRNPWVCERKSHVITSEGTMRSTTMADEHEVRLVSEQFYTAANAVLRGDAAPMLAMWSHGEDASYCDTRGEIVMGWPALELYWRRAAAINAAAPNHITAAAQIMHAVVNGNLAYVVALEEVHQEG